MVYENATHQSFIWFLATNDLSSTPRHFTTALSIYIAPFSCSCASVTYANFSKPFGRDQLVPEVSEFGLKLDSMPLKKDSEVSHELRMVCSRVTGTWTFRMVFISYRRYKWTSLVKHNELCTVLESERPREKNHESEVLHSEACRKGQTQG